MLKFKTQVQGLLDKMVINQAQDDKALVQEFVKSVGEVASFNFLIIP